MEIIGIGVIMIGLGYVVYSSYQLIGPCIDCIKCIYDPEGKCPFA
jgi:hypothetical protein